ncbi:hypothetical protein LCGC14_0429060 [marine sediment metagenome]|uniref:Terminase small subunit n=1 Tax=marine sediment metagenome TaxID=412755 RepID=A0A0F9VY32_9ZZZZ
MGTKLIKPRKRGGNWKYLTSGQYMFCLEMLASKMMNAAEAARNAGYHNPAQAANKLMKIKRVALILKKEMEERIDRTKLSADRILEEVAYCALRDPLDLCDENGKIIMDDMRKLPERIRRCIDGIKLKRYVDAETGDVTETMEMKLVSKMSALELAARHFGLIGPQKLDVRVLPLDFDAMVLDQKNSADPIEERLQLEENGSESPS